MELEESGLEDLELEDAELEETAYAGLLFSFWLLWDLDLPLDGDARLDSLVDPGVDLPPSEPVLEELLSLRLLLPPSEPDLEELLFERL